MSLTGPSPSASLAIESARARTRPLSRKDSWTGGRVSSLRNLGYGLEGELRLFFVDLGYGEARVDEEVVPRSGRLEEGEGYFPPDSAELDYAFFALSRDEPHRCRYAHSTLLLEAAARIPA